MAKIELDFTVQDQHVTLESVHFSHPLLESSIISVRGKHSSNPSTATFTWTAAVKALALLFVRASVPDTPALISGEQSSLASSLDYAISKQPSWLMDMFGVDGDGKSLVKRLVVRRNSERKRPGPVFIELRRNQVEVVLSVNSVKQSDYDEMVRIAEIIGSSCPSSNALHISLSVPPSKTKVPLVSNTETLLHTPFGNQNFLNHFTERFNKHVEKVLRETNIFTKKSVKNGVTNLVEDPSFVNVAGQDFSSFNSLISSMCGNARLGLLSNNSPEMSQLQKSKPIRVALSPASIGPLVLFTYLKHIKKLNIQIDFKHMNSIVMTNSILGSESELSFDICSLSSGSYAALLARRTRALFEPFMISPRVPYGVMKTASSKKNKLNEGNYCFISDHPSTSRFYFDSLVRSKKIDKRKISISHLEQDEITELFQEGVDDIRAILWFPYDILNEFLNDAYVIDQSDQGNFVNELMLASKRLIANRAKAEALQICLRDAWLSLIENSTLRAQTVSILFSTDDYLQTIARCGGLRTIDMEVINQKFPSSIAANT